MTNLFLKKYCLWFFLALASILLYLLDYYVLNSFRDVAGGFLGNLAFLPVYVLFVTLMVEQLMKERERQIIMRKLNMVIGVFFSEVGNELLKDVSQLIVNVDQLRSQLGITPQWTTGDYKKASEFTKTFQPEFVAVDGNKERLKTFLVSRRSFLVGLMENQNLLEHEEFTDLLWAVFHLLEELEARKNLDKLPAADIEHINGDIRRVFGFLGCQWLSYMNHLRQDYPYLFSLAIRLNPMVSNNDPHVY